MILCNEINQIQTMIQCPIKDLQQNTLQGPLQARRLGVLRWNSSDFLVGGEPSLEMGFFGVFMALLQSDFYDKFLQ
jgi:hypothetical protein